MHPVRRDLNRVRGTKISGRQWRKYRKAQGLMTVRKLRIFERSKKIAQRILRRQK